MIKRGWAALTRYPAVALALLMLPALGPLFGRGYFFAAHDAHHSVFWLVEFDQTFRDGALWPIWAPDHLLGFGYPLWLIYAPLAYYLGEAFHLLGLGFVAATKAAWAFGFLCGGFGVYRLGRYWWGRTGGIIAALAFTYAPYHLVQIYVRAALAEFIALAVLPWAVWALVRVWDAPTPRRAAGAALSIGLLLLSHSGAAALFLPLVIATPALKTVVALWPWQRPHRTLAAVWATLWRPLRWTFGALALGIALASIFLIPLLAEKQFTGQEIWLRNYYSYTNHFVYPQQFFDPFWGYGHSVPGPDDGMSFQLGWMPFLGAVLGSVALLRKDALAPLPRRVEALAMLVVSSGAIFLMTPASEFAWRAITLLSLLQFPWRLLSATAFSLALLTGAGIHWAVRRQQARRAAPAEASQTQLPAHLTLIVAAAAIVGFSLPYVRAQISPVRPIDERPLAVIEFELKFPDMRGVTAWAERQPRNEDSPLLAQYMAQKPLTKAAVVGGVGEIISQSHTANQATARVRATGPIHLRFYTTYFPGWIAAIDGQPAAVTPDAPNGLIGIEVPAGEHEVTVRFTATPVRRMAGAISGFALALLAVWGLIPSRLR